ncbi:MAG: hypothetical protein C3F08_00725 [Candidatus Methylomirabilota bacterium]|nr:MAG: hypothetical protein C3F08_00725 [candidate division NC10 bacterium]
MPYWIYENGESIGPLERAEVSARAKPNSLVSCGQQWIHFGDHPDFRELQLTTKQASVVRTANRFAKACFVAIIGVLLIVALGIGIGSLASRHRPTTADDAAASPREGSREVGTSSSATAPEHAGRPATNQNIVSGSLLCGNPPAVEDHFLREAAARKGHITPLAFRAWRAECTQETVTEDGTRVLWIGCGDVLDYGFADVDGNKTPDMVAIASRDDGFLWVMMVYKFPENPVPVSERSLPGWREYGFYMGLVETVTAIKGPPVRKEGMFTTVWAQGAIETSVRVDKLRSEVNLIFRCTSPSHDGAEVVQHPGIEQLRQVLLSSDLAGAELLSFLRRYADYTGTLDALTTNPQLLFEELQTAAANATQPGQIFEGLGQTRAAQRVLEGILGATGLTAAYLNELAAGRMTTAERTGGTPEQLMAQMQAKDGSRPDAADIDPGAPANDAQVPSPRPPQATPTPRFTTDQRGNMFLTGATKPGAETPQWVPVYSNGKFQNPSYMGMGEALVGGFEVVTPDAANEVVEFYRTSLRNAGFTLDGESTSSVADSGRRINAHDKSNRRTVEVAVGRDGEATIVTVSYRQGR